jgi:Spy/CpxP family protein refolding chaperone
MKRTFIASTIAAAFAFAAASAFAQTQAPVAPTAPTQAERVYGYQLMTPEERAAYQEQMRAASTWEERQKMRDAHRALMDQRAKEKGVTLAEPRGPRYGAGSGPGPHGGPGAGPRGDGPYSQLFTPEERDAFRDKMHAAQTPEEREKLRSEYRAQAETRAKEQGVALPPPGPRAGGPGPYGGHRGAGPGPGGRGGMYGDLLTPEERQAFHAQMQAATTPEARAKVRESHHAALQARAKEKGITIPDQPCGPGGPGAGPGPRAECGGAGSGWRGAKAGPGAGVQGRGAGAQLLSADERAAFRSRMQAASTAEERQKIRDQHRAVIEARAKEQGMTLPESGRGPRGRGWWQSPQPQPNVPQQPYSA